MHNIFNSSQVKAFQKAISENPGDIFLQEIYGDFLRENGIDEFICQETILTRIFRPLDICNVIIGRGIGSGSGSGSGRSIGIGIGRSIGSGSGSGRDNSVGVIFMEVGKRYLIHCGDWHTYVGLCTKQIGPTLYEMEKVSKIYDTHNEDCWEELAIENTKLREKAEYRHYKTKARVPLTIICFEWYGNLPQEDNLPEKPPK